MSENLFFCFGNVLVKFRSFNLARGSESSAEMEKTFKKRIEFRER